MSRAAARGANTKGHGEPRKTTQRAARPPAAPGPGPVLEGPGGGEWLFVDGGEHAPKKYCSTCQSFAHRVWSYFINAHAHITICEDCVNELVES